MSETPHKTGTPRNGSPRVFISYTHESPDHKRWVGAIGTALRANGIDATLDQWDLPLDGDATLFMEKGIREADRVLLICTPTYARKANEGQGGVGYERMVVTAELAQKLDTTKFICILRAGTKEISVPAFAQTRIYVDFCEDSEHEVKLEELIRDIHNAPLNPKPPLGPNPYASCEQHFSDQPRLIEATSSTDTEIIYGRALALLRSADWVGWKHLLRETRRDIVPRLLTWRQQIEANGVPDDRWESDLQEALQIAAPLMVLAMCAVDSEHDRIRRQVGVLDDLLQIPDWNQGGYTVVVAVPGTVAFFYHHLLGSLLVDSGYQSDASDLLMMTVQVPNREKSAPLWKVSKLMGWPESLGGNCMNAWKQLLNMYSQMPWLSHFFTRPEAFYRALSAYRLLGSIVELCDFIKSGGNAEGLKKDLSFDVPVLFSRENGSDIPLGLAVPNPEVLERIASRHGVAVSTIRALWPDWFLALLEWRGRADHYFWPSVNSQKDIPPLP